MTEAKKKPTTDGEKITTGCLFLVLIGIVFFLWIALGTGGGSLPTGSTEQVSGIPKHQDAYYSAQTIIERQLKSPSSAKWPSHKDVKIWDMANGWVAINGHLDADNAFGASMRMKFMVTLSKTPDGWKAETLILDGKNVF